MYMDEGQHRQAVPYLLKAKGVLLDARMVNATAFIDSDLLLAYREASMYIEGQAIIDTIVDAYDRRKDLLKERRAAVYLSTCNFVFDAGEWQKDIDLARKGIEVASDPSFQAELDSLLDSGHKMYFPFKRAETYSGLFHYEIGNALRSRHDDLEAITYFEKTLELYAHELGDYHYRVAVVYSSLGISYRSMGLLHTAIKYYEKALEIAQVIGSERRIAAESENLSIVYTLLGDTQVAEQYAVRNLEIGRRKYAPPNFDIAEPLYYMGYVKEGAGMIDEAIRYYVDADAMFEALFPEGNFVNIGIKRQIGLAMVKQGHHAEGLAYLAAAERLFHQLYAVPNKELYFILRDQGLAFLTQDNTARARHQLVEARALATHVLDPGDLEYARLLLRLTDVISDPDSNRAFVATAIKQVLGDQPGVDPSRSDSDVLYANNGILFDAYEKAAKFAENPLQRIRFLRQALIVSNGARRDLVTDEAQHHFLTRAQDVVHAGLGLCLDLNKKGGYAGSADDILFFMEKSKGILLLDAISLNESRLGSGVPDTLVHAEKELKQSVVFYENEILKSTNSTDIDEYKERISDLRTSLSVLKTRFEKEYPAFFSANYDAPILTMEDLQAKLAGSRSTLVEYFMHKAEMFRLIVNSKSWSLHTQNIDTHFEQDLAMVLNRIGDGVFAENVSNGPDEYRALCRATHSLYNFLFASSSLDSGDRLVIIPDGRLNYLPFELLLTKPAGATQVDYAALPYLLKQYPVRYAFSATLMDDTPASQTDDLRVLGFAPSYQTRSVRAGDVDIELTDLPYTTTEIGNIARYFEVTLVHGRDATKQRFVEQAADYGILHLATHAYSYDAIPDLSFLYKNKRQARALLRRIRLKRTQTNRR